MTLTSKESPVEALLQRSLALGADPRNTNYAGGNTSAKGSAVDPVTGENIELLWVKGSGGDLGTLTEAGLSVLRLDRLRSLVDVYPGVEGEDAMVGAFDFCLYGKGGAAPSIDTAMHGLVRAAHVDHLHPDSGIAFATAADGEALTRSCFGERVAWVPWRRPGFQLGPRHRQRSSSTNRPRSAPCSAATASRHGARHRMNASGTRSRSFARPSATSQTTARAIRWARPSPRTRHCRSTSGAREPQHSLPCCVACARPTASRWARSPTAMSCSISWRARSTSSWPRWAPRAPIISCAQRFGQWCSIFGRRRRSSRSWRGCTSCTRPTVTSTARYYERYATPDSPPMRGADPAIVLIPGVGMFSYRRQQADLTRRR